MNRRPPNRDRSALACKLLLALLAWTFGPSPVTAQEMAPASPTAATTAPAPPAGVPDALWGSLPYRLAIVLDLDHSGLAELQRERLHIRLLERIDNRLGLFWNVDFPERFDEGRSEATTAYDKIIHATIRSLGGAMQLELIEHDVILDQDSMPFRAEVTEAVELPERLYGAILEVFRPIARFQREPENFGVVKLSYRAAELAPASGLGAVAQDELLLPFRRRLDRDGTLAADGIQPIRWTYLIAEPPGEVPAGAAARIASHLRRPFGQRPSGRLQLIAIAAPVDPDRVTSIRLHVIDDPETPLPGYEVRIAPLGQKETKLLGFSDADGRVRLPSGDGIYMANVKCGGLYVASLPVAPGVDDEVVVPLVDERSRLRAEVEVMSLREELIDTVARRKILGERIKRLIEDDRIDLAKRLLRDLEELPGRTQFNGRLDQAERGVESAHPIARKRLEKLFTGTRRALNSALDPRETREVSLALTRAEQDLADRGEAEAGGSTDEPTPGG